MSGPPETGAGGRVATGEADKVTVDLVERRVLRQPWEAMTESFEPRGEEEALHVALLVPI